MLQLIYCRAHWKFHHVIDSWTLPSLYSVFEGIPHLLMGRVSNPNQQIESAHFLIYQRRGIINCVSTEAQARREFVVAHKGVGVACFG